MNFQMLMGRTVDEVRTQAFAFDDTFDWSQAQVKGAEVYVNGIAATLGFLSGFVGTGGGTALSRTTQVVSKGVSSAFGLRQNALLMSKGAARLLTANTRNTVRLAKVISNVAGAGLGTAVWEMGVHGRIEGYGHAAMEGMKMGPIFAIAGAAGKQMEKWLRGAKMPARAKKVIEGMFEGFALSTAEMTQINSSLWNFMRDPFNPEKAREWTVGVISAMVGFGIFKGMTGTTPSDFADIGKTMDAQARQKLVERITKGSEQMQAAMVAESKADIASVAKAMGVTPKTVRAYGEALRSQQKSGKGDPELEQELMDLETQLDLEQFALNLSPAERADARTALRWKIAQLYQESADPSEIEAWEAKLELMGEKPAPARRAALRKAAVGRRRQTTMVSRLKRQGLSMAERPDGGFDILTAEGRKLTPAQVRKRMRDTSVDLIERPGGGYDVVDRAVRTKPAKPADVAKRLKAEGLGLVELPGGGFDIVPERQMTTEQVAKALKKAGVGLVERPGRPAEARNRSMSELLKLSEAEKIQVYWERIMGPAGYASSAEMKLAESLKKLPKTPGYDVIDLRPGGDVKVRSVAPEKGVAERPIAEEPGERPIGIEEGSPASIPAQFFDLETQLERDVFMRRQMEQQEAQEGIPARFFALETQLERDLFMRQQMEPEARPIGISTAEGAATGPQGAPLGPGMPGTPKSLQLKAAHQQEPHPALAELESKWGPRIVQPDIITRMEGFKGDPVRTAIRKGLGANAKAKKWIASFKPRENLTRTSEMRNDAANAHEFAHAMEAAAEAKGVWDPVNLPEPWMRAELAKIASTYPDYNKLSPREQVAEGWAEFWARWQMGDPRLYDESPQLHDWMMKWLVSKAVDAQGFTQQITEVEELTRYWRLMGATKRAGSIVTHPGEKLTAMEIRGRQGWVEKFTTGFTKYLLDDIVELRKSERKWYDQADINAESLVISLRPSSLIDAFRMTAAQQANQMWLEGTHDITGKRTGEGAQEMLDQLEALGTLNQFIDYVLAKRAVNKIDQGFEMPGSREDFLFAVEKYEASNPEFFTYADRLRQFSMRVLNYGVEAGLYSEEQVATMLKTDPIYLPFARIIEFGGKKVSGARGVAERGTAVTPMRGGPEQVADPIDALRAQVQNVITKSQQNMVMRSMYLNHKMLRGMGGFVTEVPRDANPEEILIDRMQQELKRMGKKIGKKAEMDKMVQDLKDIVGGLDPAETALKFWFQKAVPSGASPVLAFTPRFTEAEITRLKMEGLPATKPSKFKNLAEEVRAEEGKLRWYEVDADAYNALMGIDSGQVLMEHWPAVLRGLALAPTTAVRWGATILNPAFIVRNLIRDPMTRQLFTKAESGKDRLLFGFGALAAGAVARVGKTEGVKIYDALGLGGITRVGVDIGREAEQKVLSTTIIKPLEVIANFLGAPEKFLRTTEFLEVRERLLKKGYSEFDANMEASLAAKEVTVNFTRAGIMGRMLTQIYPYFNPRVQGLRKFWRAVGGAEGRQAQKQALVRGISNMGGISAMAWWFAKDTDWYKDLPLWRKVNFWTFDMSFLTGSDTPDLMTVPKPFEAGIIFGSVFENALSAFHKYDPEMTEEIVWELLAQHMVGWPFIPSAVLPYIESGLWNAEATGYSFFFERPIVPDWQIKSRVPEDQFNAYTTRTARWLGEAFGMSPSKIEHLLSQQLGGLPRRMVQTVESIANIQETAWTMNSIPFVGTLFSQRPHQSGRTEDTIHAIEYQLGQLSGSDRITGRGKSFRTQINKARARIRRVRELQRSGYYSPDEANRRTFEVASRLAERWEAMKVEDYRREPRTRR
jgi:hypothetical protein